MAEVFSLEQLKTPTRPLLVVTDEHEHLRAMDWANHAARMRRLLGIHYGVPTVRSRIHARASAPKMALATYFDGDLSAINAVVTETRGTDFQREMWRALRRISAGTTKSYSALVAAVGRPAAVHAVGTANGANPIPVVVPCHRVIGANGSLAGFGGGIGRKQWLLAHEGGPSPIAGSDMSGRIAKEMHGTSRTP